MKNMNKKIGTAASALLLMGLLLADSKYNFKITEQTLSFDNLPAAFDGLHIVHLSDLHGSAFGKDNSRLVKAVKELAPDMIVMTGDMADNADNLDVFDTLLESISAVAPCYYVSGNHEWGGLCIPQVREVLEKHSVKYLSNEYLPIYRGGEKIILAGVEDPFGEADMIKPDELVEKLRAEYPETFSLLLAHRNYWVAEYPQLPVDLVLCGHAHGGVVRLPVIGGLFNVKHTLFADYEIGVYESGRFKMLVSRGLGNTLPVPRLFNRPELLSIKLSRS